MSLSRSETSFEPRKIAKASEVSIWKTGLPKLLID